MIGARYKGKKSPILKSALNHKILIPMETYLNFLTLFCDFFSFWAQKLTSGQEDMKIKKNALPTLAL
jgi:hypothetical protein